MPGSATPEIPLTLITRLLLKKVVPLLGAGCSVAPPSSIPTAPQLAEVLVAQGAGTTGQALEDIAESVWAQGDWKAFAQLLPIDKWRVRAPNSVFRVLAEICKEGLIGPILTTNWDVLIETALNQIGQPFSKVVDAVDLEIQPAGAVTVVKVNGCIERPDRIKARRTDIESPDWLDAWVSALFDVVVRMNSLLFAGYSGASRAATTTIARLVEAGEREAEDFLVDRLTPERISKTRSGRRFINAINLVDACTEEAVTFFEELRRELFPKLVTEPHTRAKEMAAELAGPTKLNADEITESVDFTVEAFLTAGPQEFQKWLVSCFRSFADCEATLPYIPLRRYAIDIGKCVLCLAAMRWSGRLLDTVPPQLDVPANAEIKEISNPRLEVVVCRPDQRSDSVTQLVVAELDNEESGPPNTCAVGVILGGLLPIRRSTKQFSVARGVLAGNTARGGASIVWIAGEELFAAFAEDAQPDAVRRKVQDLLDEAATELLSGAAA